MPGMHGPCYNKTCLCPGWSLVCLLPLLKHLQDMQHTADTMRPALAWAFLNGIPCACFPHLQDKYHLYFLFDLMPGGDLMDVLVAEAKVIRQRVPSAAWQVACLAPKVRIEVADCQWHCSTSIPT